MFQTYIKVKRRGFKTQLLGVAMERRNQPGCNRPDAFVIDWR